MSVRNTVKSIQDIMRQDAGVDGDAQRISQLCWMFFLKIIDDQDQELELMGEGYRSPIPSKLRWKNWAADPEGITGEAMLKFVNDDLFPALKELPAGTKDGRKRVVRSVFDDAYNYMKSGYLMRQVVNKISAIDFNNLAERQHFGDIYEQILNDLQNAGNAGEYYTPRAVTAFMAERLDPKPGEVLLDPACGTGGFLTSAIGHMRKKYVKKPKDERKMQEGLRAVEKKPLPHMLCVTNMLLNGIDDPSFVVHDNTLAKPYISYTQADRVDVVLTNPPFGGKEEPGIESNFPNQFQTRETADLFLALIVRLLKPGGRAAVVLPDGTLFGEGVKTRLKEHLLSECNLHTIVRLPNGVFAPYTGIKTNLLFFTKGEPTTEVWYYEHPYPPGAKSYNKTKPIRIEEFEAERQWWDKREETEQAWRVPIDQIKAGNYNLDLKNPHNPDTGPGDVEHLLPEYERLLAEITATRVALKKELYDALTRQARESRMKLETFFQKFELFAGAPNGVEKLRALVLQLAVQGRLAPQNPSEGSGGDLLAQLMKVKAGNALEGRSGRSKSGSMEVRCGVRDVPPNWAETNIGDVLHVIRGASPRPKGDPRYFSETRTPYHWVKISDIRKHGVNGLLMDTDEFVTEAGMRKSVLLPKGTLVMTNSATIGVPIVLGVDGCCIHDGYLAFPRFPEALLSQRFFLIVLRTLKGHAEQSARGLAQLNLNTDLVRSFPFGLPPLAEQVRIVAKVDELMALCDRLETQLASSQEAAAALTRAIVAEIAGPR